MLAAGIAALCMTGAYAVAAEMDDAVLADDANFAEPAELGSGWYIRGELGIIFDGEHDVSTFGNRALGTLSENNYADRLNYRIDAGYRPSSVPPAEAAVTALVPW